MRFIVDEQCPIDLSDALTAHGHDASHVRQHLFPSANDRTVWRSAITDKAVIITKDADYLAFLRGPPPHTPVIWVRLGNCGNARLVAVFMQQLSSIEASLRAGELLIELR